MDDAYQVVVTSRSRRELTAAMAYVRDHSSPGNAVALAGRITSAIGTLAGLPHRHKRVGQSRAHGVPVRLLVSSPYLVYYRVDDRASVVYVLTILHGARLQPQQFE